MSNWFETYGYAEVYENLIVGAVPLDLRDVRTLRYLGIERVLNLVQDEEYQPGSRAIVGAALANSGIEEVRLSTVDYGGLTAELLDQSVATISNWLDEHNLVYLHCRAGWQRSATVAGAVIAAREDLDPDAALAVAQARKPSADPLPHQREDLRRWWADRRAHTHVA